MPHVIVKMRPGRTEEQRIACARAVAVAIADTIDDIADEPMIVSVMEAPREEWDQGIDHIGRTDQTTTLFIPEGETLIEG